MIVFSQFIFGHYIVASFDNDDDDNINRETHMKLYYLLKMVMYLGLFPLN